MNRSSEDLVKELINEPGNFELLGIALEKKNEPIFIWRGGSGRTGMLIMMLDLIVKSGGKPVGLVGWRSGMEEVSLAFYSRPFAEFSGEKWAEDFLKGLSDATRTSSARTMMPLPSDPHAN